MSVGDEQERLLEMGLGSTIGYSEECTVQLFPRGPLAAEGN